MSAELEVDKMFFRAHPGRRWRVRKLSRVELSRIGTTDANVTVVYRHSETGFTRIAIAVFDASGAETLKGKALDKYIRDNDNDAVWEAKVLKASTP